ncbi:sugar phosphate nucleotidyltransferase [Streptomyces sp. M10(2022)]
MKAVVMAGGEGTRLRPMTSSMPKPLLPVANRPIMEHVLRLLKRHGLNETVVTVQFLASLVKNYFGDGEELGWSSPTPTRRNRSVLRECEERRGSS